MEGRREGVRACAVLCRGIPSVFQILIFILIMYIILYEILFFIHYMIYQKIKH